VIPFGPAFGMAGRRFIEFNVTANDDTLNVATLVGTTADAPFILFNLNGHDILTTNTTQIAINASTVNDFCDLVIDFEGGKARARGGDGGDGGWEDADPTQFFPGGPGGAGGTAISLGCNTKAVGPGDVLGGFGGGGGGGSQVGADGCGGGGGAPLGLKGVNRSIGNNPEPADGTDATELANGVGGTANGLNGGNGGDGGGAPQDGENGVPALGGDAGANGKAVDLNGFTWTTSGGLNIVGAVS